MQELLVADLHRVLPSGGQPRKEGVQVGRELLGTRIHLVRKRAEFEDQHSYAVTIGLQRLKKCGMKKRKVQVRFIRQARTRSVPWMRGETFAGDFFRNLEREAQARRGRCEQLLPELIGRELVKREVTANDGKCLCVFSKAAFFEALLRESPADQIRLTRVDLAHPALVFP
jgi:hypothetical protein